MDVAAGEKCEDVLKKSGLNIEQFYKLNLDVKEDCSNLWPSKCRSICISGGEAANLWDPDYQYCVETSG